MTAGSSGLTPQPVGPVRGRAPSRSGRTLFPSDQHRGRNHARPVCYRAKLADRLPEPNPLLARLRRHIHPHHRMHLRRQVRRKPRADIETNLGTGGDEDPVYVLRASDVVLWELGIRARVLPETKAQNLTVLLQLYGYLAFSAARYPQSVVEITGLTAPTF
jgi:hypothetical protein